MKCSIWVDERFTRTRVNRSIRSCITTTPLTQNERDILDISRS